MRDLAIVRPPILVLGWGNLSRADDALGPMFVTALRDTSDANSSEYIEFLEDYQLQVEHALDLVGRVQVLFVDASVSCAAPFEVRTVLPSRDTSYTSHALSPEALLQVFLDCEGCQPPSATLLAIRGDSFELGISMGASATCNLHAALAWARQWLAALQSGLVKRATTLPLSSSSTS